MSGNSVNPFSAPQAKATVLVFVSNDCPISNRYIPELERLQKRFADQGVKFWLVHADPTETADSIHEHAREFGLTTSELCDPRHTLVKLSHAQSTPTAAVFTQGNRLVYRGRIDDRAADLHLEHPAPLHHDLADALEAILAGRAVAEPSTPVVGCNIPGTR